MNFLELVIPESAVREIIARPVVDAFLPTIREEHAHEATGESRKNERTINAKTLLRPKLFENRI